MRQPKPTPGTPDPQRIAVALCRHFKTRRTRQRIRNARSPGRGNRRLGNCRRVTGDPLVCRRYDRLIKLFEWRVRNRLRDDSLLVVKAARKTDTRCDDDGANDQKSHDATPRYNNPIDHKGFWKENGGIFDTGRTKKGAGRSGRPALHQSRLATFSYKKEPQRGVRPGLRDYANYGTAPLSHRGDGISPHQRVGFGA